MVIGIFGESCTGKTSLAGELCKKCNFKLYSGNDFLKLEKSETAARAAFQKLLAGEGNFIYVISEKEQLSFLPEDAFRIRMKASLETIKERFAARMHGQLPPPVASMLERKFGMFDGENCHMVIDTDEDTPALAAEKVLRELEAFS